MIGNVSESGERINVCRIFREKRVKKTAAAALFRRAACNVGNQGHNHVGIRAVDISSEQNAGRIV